MSIRKDLEEGDVAERRLISMLQNAGLEAIKNAEKATRSFWDVEAILIDVENDATIAEFTIEVKNDVYAIRSGNIAIEIFNPKSNKNSGLSITKADLWAVQVGEEFWIARTEKLRKYTEEQKPHRHIPLGGDNNATILLYKREHILPSIFHRVDTLCSMGIRTLIAELL